MIHLLKYKQRIMNSLEGLLQSWNLLLWKHNTLIADLRTGTLEDWEASLELLPTISVQEWSQLALYRPIFWSTQFMSLWCLRVCKTVTYSIGYSLLSQGEFSSWSWRTRISGNKTSVDQTEVEGSSVVR